MNDWDIFGWIQKALEVIGVGFLLVIGITITLRVITRPLQFLPDFLWTGEIARYCLALMAIIGVPYAIQTNDHISIRQLLESFLGQYRVVLFIATDLIVVLFSLFLAYSSYIVAGRTLDTSLPTIRWLNYGYMNIIMSIAFVLTALLTIRNIIGLWHQYRTRNERSEE